MTEYTEATLFQALQALFAQLQGGYRRLDGEADARIVRWRYAIDSAFELQADYFRRTNANPGKLLDEEPVSAANYHAYGYDAQERLIFGAVFGLNDLPHQSRFYLYGEHTIDMAEYGVELLSERYHLQKVARLAQSATGKPLMYGQYSPISWQAQAYVETVHYDDQGRITRITSVHTTQPNAPDSQVQDGLRKAVDQQQKLAQMLGTKEQSAAMLGQFEHIVQNMMNQQQSETRREEIYEYDGETLKRIVSPRPEWSETVESGPHEQVIYEAPKSGETEAELFEAARVNLLAAIRDHLRQPQHVTLLRQPVYNMVMSYDAVADDGISVMFGFEKQRQEWERKTHEHTYRSLVYDQPPSPARIITMLDLPPAYNRFVRLRRQDQRWDAIRDLMNRVARDLNMVGWDGILHTTDDFIVFASDYEALEDVHDEIRACVPAEKVQMLIDKGLL